MSQMIQIWQCRLTWNLTQTVTQRFTATLSWANSCCSDFPVNQILLRKCWIQKYILLKPPFRFGWWCSLQRCCPPFKVAEIQKQISAGVGITRRPPHRPYQAHDENFNDYHRDHHHYCTISVNSSPSVTRYLPDENFNSSHGKNDRYIKNFRHIFSKNIYI